MILCDQKKFSLVLLIAYCAMFYALPKVLKINIPLKPIITNTGTVIYPLEKFLASTFPTLCGNNTHTLLCLCYSQTNSYAFCERIKIIPPENADTLSPDVEFLFTNVPVEEALNCLETRMLVFDYTDFEIRQLLSLTWGKCVEQSIFIFNDKFCKQSDVTAVFSSVPSFLCDI